MSLFKEKVVFLSGRLEATDSTNGVYIYGKGLGLNQLSHFLVACMNKS